MPRGVRVRRMPDGYTAPDQPMASRFNILVVGPHPDDQELGMGGSIAVESKHYQGSTFTFRIPAAASEAPREVSALTQTGPRGPAR